MRQAGHRDEMSYGETICIGLLLVVIFQRGIKLWTLKEIKKSMSTQEERLRDVQTKLTAIADGVNTLQQQVEDLKTNHPDLEDEIAGIEATVKAIADDLNPPVSEPVPEEPPV